MTDYPLWLGWLIVSVVVGAGLLWASTSYLKRKQVIVIEDANARMQLRIPESSLKPRKTIIESLLRDPELLSRIEEMSVQQNVSTEELTEKARRYAREIGPAFSTYFYFKLGYWLSRTLLRMHFCVRTVSVDEHGLDSISANSTVILVSNHRSNMDPLLITYLASRRSTVAMAAGEWARMWPFYHLVRAAGGYVVDRNAADPLYRSVLGFYVRMAAASGVHHGVFPEGKLTRDGKMQSPRLGFLNYFCRALSHDRDIVFIPVGVNYDRIPEDRNLVRAQHGFQDRGMLYLIGSSIRYIGAVLTLPLSQREHRFGYACAAFGTPVSLQQWLREHGIDSEQMMKNQRYEWLPTFAQEMMTLCGEQIPVPPVVLVATVMCENPQRDEWGFAELQAQATTLIERLREKRVNVYMPGDIAKTLTFAMEMLTHHKFVKRIADDRFAMIPSEKPVLQYYANSVAHLVS